MNITGNDDELGSNFVIVDKLRQMPTQICLTLAQVMICCLTAPSHYLNNVDESPLISYSPGGDFTELHKITVLDISPKIIDLSLQPHSQESMSWKFIVGFSIVVAALYSNPFCWNA